MDTQMNPNLKQTTSPKLTEFTAILQMNLAELHQHLQNLALENPLMDLESAQATQAFDTRKVYAPDDQNRVYARQDRKDSLDPWNLDISMRETLSDTLMAQLGGLKLDTLQRRVLTYMILNLEPTGYLEMEPVDVAQATGVTPDEAESLLRILQTLEPDGIGARSLPECLAIQLKKNHPEDHTALAIAQNYLELFGKNQLPTLARKLHVPLDEVLRAGRVIRSLNPRPGAAFGERRYMQYIRPDLAVVKFQGYYDILVNESLLPTIRLNEEYLDMMKNSESSEVTTYLTAQKRQLDRTSECLEQRNQTLLALGRLIVQKQQIFFQNGPGHLVSFSLAEAAADLQIPESVVRCAVKDKFLQCTFGIFPLSYFFVQALEKKDSIQQKIREIIAKEDKKHPLSDARLAEILAMEGLTVSRRLIAKYRNEMDIPESGRRREF